MSNQACRLMPLFHRIIPNGHERYFTVRDRCGAVDWKNSEIEFFCFAKEEETVIVVRQGHKEPLYAAFFFYFYLMYRFFSSFELKGDLLAILKISSHIKSANCDMILSLNKSLSACCLPLFCVIFCVILCVINVTQIFKVKTFVGQMFG